jgi:membrane protein involved in colicin uptake
LLIDGVPAWLSGLNSCGDIEESDLRGDAFGGQNEQHEAEFVRQSEVFVPLVHAAEAKLKAAFDARKAAEEQKRQAQARAQQKANDAARLARLRAEVADLESRV